jgi:hypothetical protein
MIAQTALASAGIKTTLWGFLPEIIMTKTKTVATAVLLATVGILLMQKKIFPHRFASVDSPTLAPEIVVRENGSGSGSSHERSGVHGPVPASPMEMAIQRLQAGIQTIDETAIEEALLRFWNEFDAASPEEKIELRAAIAPLVELWPRVSPRVKQTVLGTLRRFEPATQAMVDIYVEALANGDLAHLGTAGLMSPGPAGIEASAALIGQLRRNYRVNDSGPINSSTARMSLEALGNLGPAAADAVPLLKEFLNDTNILYRIIGAKAYWKITQDNATVLPILVQGLRDSHYWAAQILKEMGPAALDALPELKETYTNGEASMKLYAYQAIRAVDPSLLPDRSALRGLLENENKIVRFEAAETLWNEYRDPEQVIEALIGLSAENQEKNGTDVIGVLRILGELGPVAEKALPSIQRVLDESSSVRLRVAASNAWVQIAPYRPVPE